MGTLYHRLPAYLWDVNRNWAEALFSDPVAGYVYLMDSVDRIAYRLPLEVKTQSVRNPHGEETPGVAYELLGMRTMSSVKRDREQTDRDSSRRIRSGQ